jgi:hypothetical protein
MKAFDKCSRRVAHKTRKEGAFSARVLAHNSRKRSLNALFPRVVYPLKRFE